MDESSRTGPIWTSPSGAVIHRHKIRVYIEDTDSGGIVYYANYLRFAERARTEMLRSAGISHARMMAEDGLVLAVRRCEVEYLRPARLDDELLIETRVAGLGGATIDLAQRIRRLDGDGEIDLVQLAVRIACVGSGGRAARLPAALRTVLRQALECQAGSQGRPTNS
jgi:acyl-CoA thioester hydrolase